MISKIFVTVHPHPCPPPSRGRKYGSNKRSPLLVGGVRACPVPDTGGGGELLQIFLSGIFLSFFAFIIIIPDVSADETQTTPTLSATPSPASTPSVCEADSVSISPGKITLNWDESSDVTVTVTGEDDCFVQGETVKTKINAAGKKRITVSPESQETDENGESTFTITAKNNGGNAKVSFKAGSTGRSLIARVSNCTDISGRWYFSDRGTIKCTYEGESESSPIKGSGSVNITQKSCKVKWRDPKYDVNRKGSVKGSKIIVSGKFAIALTSKVKISQNSYVARGTIKGNKIRLKGSGKVTGTYAGINFTCEGSDTAVFTRSGDTPDLKIKGKNQTAGESSPSCLYGALKLFQSAESF